MAVQVLAGFVFLAAITFNAAQGQGGSFLPTKGRECFGNTVEHVTKSMELLKAFRFAKLADNKNLSCISSCLMKKYAVMQQDGTLDPSKAKKLVQKIREPTFKSVIEMRLTSCIEDATSDDDCQTAGKFIDCVAKSGSYKNWGNVISKNFKNIFGTPPPPLDGSSDAGDSGAGASETDPTDGKGNED